MFIVQLIPPTAQPSSQSSMITSPHISCARISQQLHMSLPCRPALARSGSTGNVLHLYSPTGVVLVLPRPSPLLACFHRSQLTQAALPMKCRHAPAGHLDESQGMHGLNEQANDTETTDYKGTHQSANQAAHSPAGDSNVCAQDDSTPERPRGNDTGDGTAGLVRRSALATGKGRAQQCTNIHASCCQCCQRQVRSRHIFSWYSCHAGQARCRGCRRAEQRHVMRSGSSMRGMHNASQPPYKVLQGSGLRARQQALHVSSARHPAAPSLTEHKE